jgi:hypothetical protein
VIKSIKLANSYSTQEVGFLAKDLSNLYNNHMNVQFCTVILNKLFQNLIEENSIKNKIKGLLININKKNKTEIKDISETIQKAITNCKFSDEMQETILDGFETLSWDQKLSATELLSKKQHRIDLIASPNYITKPIMIKGIEKNNILEQLKNLYNKFFSYEEIIYRIRSNIDNDFSIAVLMQKHDNQPATAFAIPKKDSEKAIDIYVFPGLINITEIERPSSDVRPDYYLIDKDTLKLKKSIAGKQKYKNIVNDGVFLKQECQINNFILNDAVAVEIARITKRISSLLEKNIQAMFKIISNKLEIFHVSNLLDIQKEHHNKIKTFQDVSENKEDDGADDDVCPDVEEFQTEEECDTKQEIETETYEPITKRNHELNNNPQIIDESIETKENETLVDAEKNNEQEKSNNSLEHTQEHENKNTEINKIINTDQKETTEDLEPPNDSNEFNTASKDQEMSYDDLMNSGKSLNELMQEKQILSQNTTEEQENIFNSKSDKHDVNNMDNTDNIEESETSNSQQEEQETYIPKPPESSVKNDFNEENNESTNTNNDVNDLNSNETIYNNETDVNDEDHINQSSNDQSPNNQSINETESVIKTEKNINSENTHQQIPPKPNQSKELNEIDQEVMQKTKQTNQENSVNSINQNDDYLNKEPINILDNEDKDKEKKEDDEFIL